MPELPETETIARDLDAAIQQAHIVRIDVLRADVLREITSRALIEQVTGSRIARVWRRAKLVVLDLNQATTKQGASGQAHLVVQPRFTGALLLDDHSLPASQLDYLTLSLHFEDGRKLHYRDVRRLGTVTFMSSSRFDDYSADLGPEPLDELLTESEFSVLVRASGRAIKSLLMDQQRLAGVGNIYANEALWHAKIDPSRVSSSLSATECRELLACLRQVLVASIAARGTSFRDYRDAHGQRGGYTLQLAAYGRGGQPCLRCGRRLVETHAVDARTTVFCATCQR